MKVYDIFASECGYRVCGAVWAGGPVIDSSPWFSTREEAEACVQKMKQEDFERDAEEIAFYGAPENLFSPAVRKRAKEILRAAEEEAGAI